jgi:dTDP-4-dehydrorhamnose reductase
VLHSNGDALVVRTSAFFGPWDRYNYITVLLRALTQGQPFHAADDTVISPTYVPDLVNACLDLLIDEERGVWHLANDGAVTWAELGRRAAALARADASRLEPRNSRELGLRARRPAFSALGTTRGPLLPSLDNALERYVRDAAPVHLRR